MPKKVGHGYDEALVTKIVNRVSEGETLRAVCRDLGKPDRMTFMRWVVADINGLYSRYARAREAQAESWADEIIEVAYDATNDTTTKGQEGLEVANHEWISRSRLKVDSLKWLMAKLHPKQYGEKIEQTVKGDMTHKVDDSVTALLAEIRNVRRAT